jgi:hypothetical protein
MVLIGFCSFQQLMSYAKVLEELKLSIQMKVASEEDGEVVWNDWSWEMECYGGMVSQVRWLLLSLVW